MTGQSVSVSKQDPVVDGGYLRDSPGSGGCEILPRSFGLRRRYFFDHPAADGAIIPANPVFRRGFRPGRAAFLRAEKPKMECGCAARSVEFYK